jgi:Cu(I)/Ag(I) efflux system membrane fusion protein
LPAEFVMINSITTTEGEPPGGRQNRTPATGTLAQRIALAARVVQVRLRFVAVLLAAFLIVGFWGSLRNVWDTMVHRMMGAHVGQQAVSGDTEYWCPMCPGVVSDWPAICPVCNMDLIRRKKGEAVVLPEGLVARMQFSPYRVQLAGIRTSLISRQPLTREIVLGGRLKDLLKSDNLADTVSPAVPRPLHVPEFVLECEPYAGDLVLLNSSRPAEISMEGMRIKPIAGTIIAGADAPAASEKSLPVVRIRLEDPPGGLRAGMYGTARVAIPLEEIEPFASRTRPAAPSGEKGGFVAVLETAVVDTGSRRVVFVETMPGMFDGVEVTLGPRCGDFFPVLAGLDPGQRVATVGAFLIDAEARLNRNLAASYFGASRSGDPEPAASASVTADGRPFERPKSKKSPAPKLSAADQQLADRQKLCPVTGARLDSMGGPIAVEVAGQRIFICCKGCEAPLKKDPRKYLAKLKANQ